MNWAERIRQEISDLDRRMAPYDMGEQQLDDDLVALFEQTLVENTRALTTAHDAGDDKGVAGAAHSIKGMGGMAGCPEISALAEEMERRLHADDRAGLTRLVDMLAQYVKERCERPS